MRRILCNWFSTELYWSFSILRVRDYHQINLVLAKSQLSNMSVPHNSNVYYILWSVDTPWTWLSFSATYMDSKQISYHSYNAPLVSSRKDSIKSPIPIEIGARSDLSRWEKYEVLVGREVLAAMIYLFIVVFLILCYFWFWFFFLLFFIFWYFLFSVLFYFLLVLIFCYFWFSLIFDFLLFFYFMLFFILCYFWLLAFCYFLFFILCYF